MFFLFFPSIIINSSHKANNSDSHLVVFFRFDEYLVFGAVFTLCKAWRGGHMYESHHCTCVQNNCKMLLLLHLLYDKIFTQCFLRLKTRTHVFLGFRCNFMIVKQLLLALYEKFSKHLIVCFDLNWATSQLVSLLNKVWGLFLISRWTEKMTKLNEI